MLNTFQTLIYPSSEACDCVDELPHRSSCSQFVACWGFCCGWYLVVFVLQAEACKTKLCKEALASDFGQKEESFFNRKFQTARVSKIMLKYY